MHGRLRARIVQPRANHPLPPSIAANDERLLPDMGMNERGVLAYRFFWLKPVAPGTITGGER